MPYLTLMWGLYFLSEGKWNYLFNILPVSKAAIKLTGHKVLKNGRPKYYYINLLFFPNRGGFACLVVAKWLV